MQAIWLLNLAALSRYFSSAVQVSTAAVSVSVAVVQVKVKPSNCYTSPKRGLLTLLRWRNCLVAFCLYCLSFKKYTVSHGDIIVGKILKSFF